MAELVHYTVDNGVATVTLDSPHNRNALSAQLRRELRDHLSTALEDDAVRVVVITGSGGSFSAGADISGEGRVIDVELDIKGVRPQRRREEFVRCELGRADPIAQRSSSPPSTRSPSRWWSCWHSTRRSLASWACCCRAAIFRLRCSR